MSTHAANADNSARLQRVLAVLDDGQEHTTYEILHQAQVAAVNSIIYELRLNGYDIACQRHNGRFHYKLSVIASAARQSQSPFEGGAAKRRGMLPPERTAQ